MRNLLICLMALVFVGCEKCVLTSANYVTLSNLTIECIQETTISNNTSANKPFTTHTYLCRGEISDYNGVCYIVVMHQNFILHNDHELLVAGDKMPFEFTFAPEWQYLDAEYNNFKVFVNDSKGNALCMTTVVVTKHAEEVI